MKCEHLDQYPYPTAPDEDTGQTAPVINNVFVCLVIGFHLDP